MVRNLKTKYEWRFCILKCKKIDHADAIISEAATNTGNNVFSRKHTPNKASRNIFRDLKPGEKVRLVFWRAKKSMTGKCYVARGYKQRNQVFLLYLECNREQHTYGWCIFKLNLKKTVDKGTSKQAKHKQGAAHVFEC